MRRPAAKRAHARRETSFVARRFVRMAAMVVFGAGMVGAALGGPNGAVAFALTAAVLLGLISAPAFIRSLYRDGKTTVKRAQAVRQEMKRREADPVVGSVSIAVDAGDGALSEARGSEGALSEADDADR